MSKELIERLLDNRVTGCNLTVAAVEAADLIEAQAAQIEMWKGTLQEIADNATSEYEDGWCGALANEALLIATPNEALQAFAEKVREQCIEACRYTGCGIVCNMLSEAAIAKIRNLKELPK